MPFLKHVLCCAQYSEMLRTYASPFINLSFSMLRVVVEAQGHAYLISQQAARLNLSKMILECYKVQKCGAGGRQIKTKIIVHFPHIFVRHNSFRKSSTFLLKVAIFAAAGKLLSFQKMPRLIHKTSRKQTDTNTHCHEVAS